MALAVIVFFLNYGSSSPSASAPVAAFPTTGYQPAASARPVGHAKGHGKKVKAAPRSLDPTLRYDWLKASEDTKYEGTGRNIFQAQAEIPRPEGPGVTDPKKVDNTPPPPPPPPPINLKFFGF